MAGFRDMPVVVQVLLAGVIAIVLGAGVWWVWVKPVNDDNEQKQIALDQKKADNETLRRYERDLPGLERRGGSFPRGQLLYHPDGRTVLVSAPGDEPALAVVEADTGQVRDTLRLPARAEALACRCRRASFTPKCRTRSTSMVLTMPSSTFLNA